MPTFESLARFDRQFRRLPRELQAAFVAMLPTLIAALRASPPSFHRRWGSSECRAGKTSGRSPSHRYGRATFAYGDEAIADTPHVIWRPVGTHDALRDA